MKNLYQLEKIYKTYKNYNTDYHALEDINLNLHEGEIIVVLGPSGSGKSTMLNLLSGIDTPSKGKIYFNDTRIDQLKPQELTEYRAAHLGFIFQSYNLIANLTVKENIELGKQLSKNPLSIKSLIEQVGLESHANKYPYQLSGGQMQRVAIARALVKNPEVLFCDEPTGALDEETGKKVLEILQDMNATYHTTMIIVTHNPSIADMAHTVIKMNSGKIVEVYQNKETKKASELRWA